MSEFIKNMWYAAAWDFEIIPQTLTARSVVGEPIVLLRTADNTVIALEDRCPHRHAPLSLGRLESGEIRCMYHGLRFNVEGQCVGVPGSAKIPPGCSVRRYPVVEKASWVWVWMGPPQKADPADIPDAFGLNNPQWKMRAGAFDYEADCQLIHDNLLDLSHLDFVHEVSLGGSLDVRFSEHDPTITPKPLGMHISRWLKNTIAVPGQPGRVDTLSEYDFCLPGTFVMTSASYPLGTADAGGEHYRTLTPLMVRVEQQAVTPVATNKSRYLYASGLAAAMGTPEVLDGIWQIIESTFLEDKKMIEAQQRNWTLAPHRRTAFIPQDKAPAMFRKLIADRRASETPPA